MNPNIPAGPLRSVLVATIALAIAALWLVLTVHYNDRDNWTALFYTGAQSTLPPQLVTEDVFLYPGSPGYDGQFYHYIAHDPFFRRGIAKYIDNPQLRYRRILIPLLAYVLAGGDEDYVDSVYIGVVLAFLWLGAYWLSRFGAVHGISPWIGLAFLWMPPVIVSLDRMTVDLALAALAIGFALYLPREEWWQACGVLIAAPLVRETGLIMIAAACLWKRKRAWLFLLCGIPFLAWEFFVRMHTNGDQTVWTTTVPYKGLVIRTLTPEQYPVTTRWLAIAATLDYLAVLGIWVALGFCVWLLWKRRFDLLAISAVLFGAFASTLAVPQIWSEAYAFGRTLSPLLIWLGLRAVVTRQWWFLAPVLMTIPSIVFQLQPQLRSILHQLFA